VAKRKKLLTALAAGSTLVGGAVALGQVTSPASILNPGAAISSSNTSNSDPRIAALDDQASKLAGQIASVRDQVDRMLAARTSAGKGSGNHKSDDAHGKSHDSHEVTSESATTDPPETHATSITSGGTTCTQSTTSSTTVPPQTHATTGASSAKGTTTTSTTNGDLRFDALTKVAWRGTRRIDLRPKEWALLEYFMRHPNHVLSRSQILSQVWDFSFDPGSNVVDVYVGYLRKKLNRPGLLPLIETVRGAGYRLLPRPA
jgi:DNA-binding winged helix-turn-helix (wHTH) protein